MTTESDPLTVLLKIKSELQLSVDDDLIKACYEIQRYHQYDKDRDTVKKMEAVIENEIAGNQDGMLI
jgi:hypothetical protein